MNIKELYRKTGKRGSLKWILVLAMGIVIASYFFDFSVQEAIEDEQTQSNFGYIRDNFVYLYDNYLRTTVEYLWNDIFIDLIWNTFIENMQNIRNGEPTILDEAAANISITNN